MQPKWIRRLGVAGLFAAIAWTAVGCAQERPAINQVQPNALSKHFFVGADLSDPADDPQFYMRNTVVDVPYGADQEGLFTASYAQPLTRVRWEIQENVLIARLTYDRIANSGPEATAAMTNGQFPPDGKGVTATDHGQVVAMFNITSHFDIRRSYNPQTGEEYNVIVENSTDRPWYQREYMRVDWSKNLVTDAYDFDSLSQIGLYGGVKFDPETYQVTDPNDPNAPAFDMDTGYFDITTKAFATPQIVDTPWGAFPACFFFGEYPLMNCNPTEVTLRLSFKRVTDDDFEPTDWDGNRMEAFGWFTEDRYGYDRNYGTIIDQNWHRYAAKYNIWQQSHIPGSQCAVDYYRDDKGNVLKYKTDGSGTFLTDPNTGLPIQADPGDPTAQPYPSTGAGQDPHRLASDNKTEQECAFADANGQIVHPGAYCDVAMNKCALPLRERQLRTIPWYYGPDSTPDLFASTGRALDQWNVAVKRAAVIGQMADAKRIGIDPTYLIQSADGSAQITDVDGNGYPTESGIIADKSDGGTKIVPNVFVLCHNPVIDGDDPACGPPGLKARIGDIRYNMVNIIPTPQTHSPWGIMVDANDPLTGEKVQTSVNEWGYVLDYVAQITEDLLKWIDGELTDQQIIDGSYMRDWVNASKAGTGNFQAKTLSTDEIKSRLAALDNSITAGNGLTVADQAMPRVLQRIKAAKALSTARGSTNLNSTFEEFRNGMIKSPLEAKFVTPHMLQAAGFDPSTPVGGDDSVINSASILRGMNPALHKWIKNAKAKAMAEQGYCSVEQPEPDALVGLARMAQKLYPLPDSKDPNYAALKLQRDNALMHWIREQFHVSVIAHEMGHSMGLRHNFTGSYDALNYKIQYWQLRSRNNQEHACTDVFTPQTDGTKCLGPRWVDPITEQEVNGLLWKWGSTTVMDYPGDQTQDMNDIGAYDKAAMRFAYGQVVDVDMDAQTTNVKGQDYIQALDGFGGIGGQTIGGLHYSQYNDKFHILNNCGAQSDPNDPLSAHCDWFKLDYVPMRDMQTVDKFGSGVSVVRPDLVSHWAVQPSTHRVRHPYMFGSDEFADFGNMPVFRFDAGADAYEQIQFVTSTYENRYVFDNFRRNRITFTTDAVYTRDQDRYFDKIESMVKTLGLLVQFSSNPTGDETDPGNLMPLALGAPDVMLTFMRVMTRPEPGPYPITPANSTPGQPLPLGIAGDINYNINNPNCLNYAGQGQPMGDLCISPGSGNGRFIENDYDYSQGYWWIYYQTKAGAWLEKELASYYLNEAYNFFVFNSEQDYVDGRYLNLNFATLYPEQMRRFYANYLAGDPMTLGPYVNVTAPQLGSVKPDVQYLPWDKTGTIDYPTGATVIDPVVGWEQQAPTYLFALMFGSTNLKSDVQNEMRIWSPGDTSTVDVPVSEQKLFRDPVSGTVYAARDYGTETVNTKLGYDVEKGIGARMLQWAQTLADQAYTQTGTVKDPVTGVDLPVYNTTTPKDANIAQKLHGYITTLDVGRMLSKYYWDTPW